MSSARFAVTMLLAAGPLFAQSPFDGTWALNVHKSNLTNQTMRIEDAGTGAVTFVDPNFRYTVKTDGTRAETPDGGSMTIVKKGTDTYHETDWLKGAETGQADWVLSKVGNTLTIHGYGTNPNGEKFDYETTYMRTRGGRGLAGQWKSTSAKINNPQRFTMRITGNLLTWDIPAIKGTLRAPLSGKAVTPTGPTIPESLTLAVSRRGSRTLYVTQQLKGKKVFAGTYTVDAAGKTMTMTGKNARGETTTETWDKQGS